MLAIQRPSMGSSKAPHLDMPFGYAFDTASSNFPFPSPTAPAPGPSLLDDNESRFLDNFFDGVGSSDQFDYNMFTGAPDGQEAGFGWDELPPSFMGTTTSFGQQPQTRAQDVPSLNFNGMPSQLHANPLPLPPTTSADVLEAATLLQNGPSGRSHSVGEGLLYNAPDMTLQPTNGHVRPQSISQFPISQSYATNHQRQTSKDFMRDTFYSEMVFGHPQETVQRQRNTNAKMDIKWGSDASFSTLQGFMAPTNRDTVAAVERAQTDQLSSAFEIDLDGGASAEASHVTSPTGVGRPPAPRKIKSNDQLDEDGDSRPKKRRKSKYQESPEDDDSTSTSNLPGLKKRKPAAIKREKDSDEIPGHKRRKSAGTSAAGKAARENLTEDQKRENHIRSEQKRRTLIREGFEDLGELVPELRGGGFSKSAVLIMAADWLEDLMQGNERLKEQLEGLEG